MPALLILVAESKILHDHYVGLGFVYSFFLILLRNKGGKMAEGNDTM
jgi:hypothetical protein